MSVRNIAIAFMIFMVLSFVAIIGLFMRLQHLTEENEIKDETIEITMQERDNLNEILESNRSKINKLTNFRTLALDQCTALEEKYPSLQDVPDSIRKEDLQDDSLWEDLNSMSIGVSYESEGKLAEAKKIMGDRDYDFYYVKKVSNLKASFVIYYNNDLKEMAESMAEVLKEVDGNFKAIRGKTPESIQQADQSNTILIHING